MITISLCMIVKNEAAVLARCLDSIADLMDEIVIVDTGSTDETKEIAARYTDRIYDFEWTGSFSDARNYSFSLAAMDYIYAADADELLDEQNRMRFRAMKEGLLPDIEMVQMKYLTEDEFNTVMNVREEYRPKLYKRLRTFEWIDPIHETVRLEPVIYDSDIEIIHRPQGMHGNRDLGIFAEMVAQQMELSGKLHNMYAKELIKVGTLEDLIVARDYFLNIYWGNASDDKKKEAACVLARGYRLEGAYNEFFKLAMRDMLTAPCSELCYDLGEYFLALEDYDEAVTWLYNAVYETEPILDIHVHGDLALAGLVKCYEGLLRKMEATLANSELSWLDQEMLEMQKEQYEEQLNHYQQQADNWVLP